MTPPPHLEAPEPPPRRTRIAESLLILICLATLWLPIAGLRGPLANAVLLVSLALMVWLFVRQKRRLDDLFEALRRQQEQMEAMGGYPGLPGMMPPPTTRVADDQRSRQVTSNGSHHQS